MKKIETVLWAGNDESFHNFLLALETVAKDAKGYVSENYVQPTNEPERSRLLTVVDGVGIISVQGTLTNTDAWYNRYYNLVSYGEIIEALHQAAADPAVVEVLMDAGSGGGAVSGCLDAVKAMEKIGKIKRITAFSSSLAASAMFWIIAPARERFVTATTLAGSVSVVARHVEYSKMMEEMGIKETVIRGGKFKQLANASEPLSEEALKMIQEQVDYTAKVFTESVAGYLGVSYEVMDAKMGQGREFIGQQGVDIGLVTGVSSLEDVFAKIQKRVAKSSSNNGGVQMTKKYTMAAALAATAAGLPPDGETVSVPAPETPGAPEAATVPAPEAAVVPTPETPGATEAAVVPPPETPETPVPTAESETVALLKGQLKEKEDELFDAKVQLKEQEKELAGLAVVKGLLATAANNMTVALGGSAQEKLETEPVAAVVSVYETMLAKVTEKFKVGGVASHEADSTATPAPSRYDSALSESGKIHKPTK